MVDKKFINDCISSGKVVGKPKSRKLTSIDVIAIENAMRFNDTKAKKIIRKVLKSKPVFYRVANNTTEQGLWYDFKGEFTGLIHEELSFCSNNELPMPFDPSIVGWLSTTDTMSDLYNWFSRDDLTSLKKYGFEAVAYEATEYREHQGHWIIKQSSSVLKGPVKL